MIFIESNPRMRRGRRDKCDRQYYYGSPQSFDGVHSHNHDDWCRSKRFERTIKRINTFVDIVQTFDDDRLSRDSKAACSYQNSSEQNKHGISYHFI